MSKFGSVLRYFLPVLALATLTLSSVQVSAYDPTKAARYPSQDQYRPNMDSVILRGSNSSGDASGLCAKLPALGVCRPLSERAKDAPSVLDAPGVVCDGAHDDADGIISALNMATALQSTLAIPPGKTCAIGKKITLGRARLVGSGTGSALVPLVSMDTMIEMTASLSAVRNVTFVNQNSLAKTAITVNIPEDALQSYVETNYFTGFTDFAVRHESGQHLVLRGNAFISNYGMFLSHNHGVNNLIVDNYSAGGRGMWFDRGGILGAEGVIVEKNIVFANGDPSWYALKVTGAIDFHIRDNTFESDCNTVTYDASYAGISYVHQAANWIGTRVAPGATANLACAALNVSNLVFGFYSINDTISGRSQTGVRTSATSAVTANSNAAFIATSFGKGADAAAVDMDLANMLGVSIQSPQFSGTKTIVERSNVIGRVDSGLFSAKPEVRVGLKYGLQAFGLDTITEGVTTIPSGSTTVTVTHGLPFQPSPADIEATIYNAPTNETGAVRVVSTSPTIFTIAVRNDPGTGGALISWKANIVR